ncbi:spore germination protein [Paenibacillus sp. JW14]|uniref:Spore germination protein n=1 Tax=Paenibacillus agri TaxID=2744309 RepID=A0A850EHQ9_9BACL|nr:spore germination protein [Paenibacillus agri]NUU59916.1 spore germination protein [Paenibacillus agri]
MHEGNLAALYFSTVMNKERFHNEIVPGLGRWLDHPEEWDTAFPQGTLVQQTSDLIHRILHGEVILVHADLKGHAVAVPLCAIQQRGIMEPSVEKTVLGAKKSFIEDISTNIGLMRRWLKAPGFVVRYYEVGRGSQTRIGIAYLQEEVKKDWLQEIEQKVSSIQMEYLHSHRDLMKQASLRINPKIPSW